MPKNNLILNRLFTQSLFDDLLSDNYSDIYINIVNKYVESPTQKTNQDIISDIYSILDNEYRNEYYYQNTLLNKLLLGLHSPNTTTALTQIGVGKSIADFVLINGKAVVYEIKSERDSFSRLNSQLEDYLKAFSHVYVMSSEKAFPYLNNLLKETPIGICTLTQKNVLSKSLFKKSEEYNDSLQHKNIFSILHRNEYENILLKHFQYLPQVVPVKYHSACRNLFSQIPILDAQRYMTLELKKRNKVNKNEIYSIPKELRSLYYFYNSCNRDYKKFTEFLSRDYRELNTQKEEMTCISLI